MTANILLLTFGGILLLAAVIGGGFEIKEIKIPKIGFGGRILAGIVGFLFLFLGLRASSDQAPAPVREPPPPAAQSRPSADSSSLELPPQPPGKKRTRFTIRDQLTAGLVHEQVTIFLNGQNVGTLVTTDHAPSTKIEVSVPEEGTYEYRLVALGVAEQGGMRYPVSGAWQGEITIANGKVFEIMFENPGNMVLEEVQQ